MTGNSPTVDLRYVGAVDVHDIAVLGDFYDYPFLPFPFGYTQPSPFDSAAEAASYARSVPDRFRYGDLAVFRRVVEDFDAADVRLECHVQFMPDDRPAVRVAACRRDDRGYVGVQRPDRDSIDVHATSPYELGAGVCEFLPTTTAGRHSSVVIPEFRDNDRVFDEGDFQIHHVDAAYTHVPVALADLASYATIQSHWRQVRSRGVDPFKQRVVWLSVYDDGDYVFEPGASYARPMTPSLLRTSVDALIAEDVATLREFRRD